MPIYLDNAATSFPKPESVYQAMDQSHRTHAVAAGRGNYLRAHSANHLVESTRDALAKLINANDRKEISFAFSGTDALSTAILGFVNQGDHVITTAADHTSVLRPLWHLEQLGKIELSIVDCDAKGFVSSADIAQQIRPTTKLVCITHASNVTGAIQPIQEIAATCQQNSVRLLVDAAQTIGHCPIDVQAMGCDFLAAPGHKGLFGPQGTGFLYASHEVAEQTSPLRFGGTGSSGTEFKQPTETPKKFESGNINIASIAGLAAGIKWLESQAGAGLLKQLSENSRRLLTGLNSIPSFKLYGVPDPVTACISFNLEGLDCHAAGMLLESEFEIECRTGLHCAPLIHPFLGSESYGGTIRFSPGPFNTAAEIDIAIESISKMSLQIQRTVK